MDHPGVLRLTSAGTNCQGCLPETGPSSSACPLPSPQTPLTRPSATEGRN